MGDAIAVAASGVAARRLRSSLSVLGVAVAIAALVAVLGIAASAKAALLAQLGQEANLLTVAAGQTFTGNPTPLPETAAAMIAAIPPVREVTAVATTPGVSVRRSAAVPEIDTGGISVLAAQPSLPHALSATLVRGHFLDALSEGYPELVLGYGAAQYLGVSQLTSTTEVYLSGRYFLVIGILAPVAVAPEIDQAALVSFAVARTYLRLTAGPTRIYLRTDPDQVAQVASVLPFTAEPAMPEAVEVRRPSDILVARIATRTAFVGLFLTLGAVGLVVGAIGVANMMVISVIERRSEVGLRRALGARAGHIARQFMFEALVVACSGGVLGIALGCAATAVAARLAGNRTTIPPNALLLGLAAAMAVGVLAGGYPAFRAARLPPTDALRSL